MIYRIGLAVHRHLCRGLVARRVGALLLAIGYWSGLAVPTPAAAGLIIDIQQVGNDVVASGSGTLNLTGLSSSGSNVANAGVYPSDLFLGVGSAGVVPIDVYSGISGPSSLGPGQNTNADAGTGDAFGLGGGGSPILYVPTGYQSGSFLSGSATLTGQTILSLGLTPGTYTYTWGSGPTADYLTVDVISPAAVPEPSTAVLAMFGAVTLVIHRRTRHCCVQRCRAV